MPYVGNSIWERQRAMVDVSRTSAQTFLFQYNIPSSYLPCVRIPYSHLYSDHHEGLFFKTFTELGYF